MRRHVIDGITAEERLARSRLAADIRLKRVDQALAREQFEYSRRQPNLSRWSTLISPTGVVLVGAMLGLVGTAVGKYADYLNTKRQQETSVILKASDIPASLDAKQQAIQRARNLLWFSQAHYIDLPADFAGQLEKDAQLKVGETLAAPVIDGSASPSTRPTATCTDSSALTPMFEGFSAKPYDALPGSSGGKYRFIGFGHNLTNVEVASGQIMIDGKKVNYGSGITPEQGRKLLDQDMMPIYDAVDRMVTVTLSRQQRDSLASLAWNIGTKQVERSSLLKHINGGDFESVPRTLNDGPEWVVRSSQAFRSAERWRRRFGNAGVESLPPLARGR